ncbi:MAG: acetyl-CoA C-acyltransferase, partial [Saprospiraceae bacterium]
MKEAVIISTARTPIGRAYKGALNNTLAPTMGGWAIENAVKKAGINPAEVDDCIMGCVLTQGTGGANIGRLAGLKGGLPVTVSGMTIDRQCSSGLMAVATAAKQIITDGMSVTIGGGLDSVSLVQNQKMNTFKAVDKSLLKMHPAAYMPMLQTAEIVAKRYGISKDAQDEYALQSQQRTAAAQAAGKFDDEIFTINTIKGVMDRETKEISYHEATLTKDEGNRPSTTLEGLKGLRLVNEGGTITAGNASQLSDAASANVLMDSKLAEQRGLEPLGAYRGMAVAGCEPDEMGIGPVFAIPKLLKAAGLKMSDIGL